MKLLPLTKGFVALVDDEDFAEVSVFNWYAHDTRWGFYAARNSRKSEGSKRVIYLHRFLLPGANRVDHKDGNRMNNQKDNLRAASNAQNGQAKRTKSTGKTSVFRGVSRHSNGKNWVAQAHNLKGPAYLGLFDSQEEAARAYDAFVRKNFGEFASPNFPEASSKQ